MAISYLATVWLILIHMHDSASTPWHCTRLCAIVVSDEAELFNMGIKMYLFDFPVVVFQLESRSICGGNGDGSDASHRRHNPPAPK